MHPKSMYRVVSAEMEEKIAMSFAEEWDMVKSGWYPHPAEARQAYRAPVDEPRKPGRPRKA